MKKKKHSNTPYNPPRDEDGNIIPPKIDFDWRLERRWWDTHVFHEWDETFRMYRPIINFDSEKEFIANQKELKRKKLTVHKLFPFPEKPETKDFRFHHWVKACARTFFKEVFNYDYANGNGMTEFDIDRVILREEKFTEIQTLLASHKLEQISDLFLYIIAKIQSIYVKEIEYYERPEKVKEMKKIGKEVAKLIEVIDLVSPDNMARQIDEKLPELKNISFVFDTIDPIRIKDPFLNDSIVDAVKAEYERRTFKNWRKDLNRVTSFYNDDLEKKNFRFKVAIALHNFLKYLKVFPVKKDKSTSNAELLFIAKILDYGLIRIGAYGISDAQKIKNVRNYTKPTLHKLETYPIHLETKPDLDKLSKYFDKGFLSCVPLIQPIDIIGIAAYLAERFELHHLINEIAHLAGCVKQRKMQIGWQLSILDKNNPPDKLLEPFHNLVFSVANPKDKKKLTELSFNINGNNKKQKLKARLPLLLIERAIAEYYANHQEEFDFDIFASEITENVQERSHKVDSLGKYREPQDRFLPKFCDNFYKFLLNEAPPTPREYSARDKYSEIIAVFLQKCLVFNQLRDEEYVIQCKVKQWLQDAKGQY